LLILTSLTERCMSSTHTMDIEAEPNFDRESKCGKHCVENRKCYGCCGVTAAIILIIVLSISWDVLTPTQFGLLKNTVTGAVDLTNVYRNGRYFVGPTQTFIPFPSNLITLSYGNRSYDDQREIAARTGANSMDETSSGGQPVGLSISFQYRLLESMVPSVYQTYGTVWETSYLRFAQQAITNVAQQFTPSQFWTQRAKIEKEMLRVVNTTLIQQGYAECVNLQLRAVGFQSSYEQTITNIQLQEQLKVTKSYQLDVTRVEKEVDLLQSETDATVVEINAEAARAKAVIEGEANANALQREQQTKADMYQKLREHLNWDSTQFLQYIKMKSLNSQDGRNVVVGVNAVGTVPT